jgi:hypothetical protein
MTQHCLSSTKQYAVTGNSVDASSMRQHAFDQLRDNLHTCFDRISV